jgi:sugar-specific transcriptional regulator TrmB
VPADEFLAQLQHEQDALIGALEEELAGLGAASDLDYVWNIDGHENIMAKAREMIDRARQRVYLSLLPATYPALRDALRRAIGRGVQVVIYSTGELELPGGRVIANPMPDKVHGRVEGLWLVLVIDAEEVLVGELLTENRARASWTGSPLFVFIAEHHLRTDLYLPRVLSLLGEQALSLIQEEDRELFACAFESRLAC